MPPDPIEVSQEVQGAGWSNWPYWSDRPYWRSGDAGWRGTDWPAGPSRNSRRHGPPWLPRAHWTYWLSWQSWFSWPYWPSWCSRSYRWEGGGGANRLNWTNWPDWL